MIKRLGDEMIRRLEDEKIKFEVKYLNRNFQYEKQPTMNVMGYFQYPLNIYPLSISLNARSF